MHKAKENMMDQIESSSESVRLLENKERDILYEMEQTSQEKSVVTKPNILTLIPNPFFIRNSY